MTPRERLLTTLRGGIIAVGKPGGRYIFSTSDFLERGTPRENVVAMLSAARESTY